MSVVLAAFEKNAALPDLGRVIVGQKHLLVVGQRRYGRAQAVAADPHVVDVQRVRPTAPPRKLLVAGHGGVLVHLVVARQHRVHAVLVKQGREHPEGHAGLAFTGGAVRPHGIGRVVKSHERETAVGLRGGELRFQPPIQRGSRIEVRSHGSGRRAEVDAGVIRGHAVVAIAGVQHDHCHRPVVHPVVPLLVSRVCRSIGRHLEIGNVFRHALLGRRLVIASASPAVVLVVARRRENGERTRQVVERSGVVPPELVPVSLLTSSLGQIAGNKNEIGVSARHDLEILCVPLCLVHQVQAAGTAPGLRPLGVDAGGFRFRLRVTVCNEPDGRTGGRGRAELVGNRDAVLRDDVGVRKPGHQAGQPGLVSVRKTRRNPAGKLGPLGGVVVQRRSRHRGRGQSAPIPGLPVHNLAGCSRFGKPHHGHLAGARVLQIGQNPERPLSRRPARQYRDQHAQGRFAEPREPPAGGRRQSSVHRMGSAVCSAGVTCGHGFTRPDRDIALRRRGSCRNRPAGV